MNQAELEGLRELPRDVGRGTWAMALFITTEAWAFLMLFFSYFYLSRDKPHWPTDMPPRLTMALAMLAVLGTSSVVLDWGERRLQHGSARTAKVAVVATIALGVAFLVLQAFEYKSRLRLLTPGTDAYGSIFYTITSIHALHVVLGLMMLAYIVALPSLDASEPPHRTLHNVSLYWHFVDAVWVVIVALLYVLPNLKETVL